MNFKQNSPPIWRDANRLLLVIEEAVLRFPRYHKYSVGTELRRRAMRVCQYLSRALAVQNEHRQQWVERSLHAIDDLKITLQLAKQLKAFASFNAFTQIAELAVALGKQGGAWQQRLSSQRARAESRCSS